MIYQKLGGPGQAFSITSPVTSRTKGAPTASPSTKAAVLTGAGVKP